MKRLIPDILSVVLLISPVIVINVFTASGAAAEWEIGFFTGIAIALLIFMIQLFWKQKNHRNIALNFQKDEFSFLKTLIEKLLPPKGVL